MIQSQALLYFAEIVRVGSLRKAAENLLVTPSAISRQIANLEEELGAPLFNRSSRGMVLTDAGNALLRYVEDSQVNIRKLRSTIDSLGDLSRGSVRLAVVEASRERVSTTAAGCFPTIILTFTSRSEWLALTQSPISFLPIALILGWHSTSWIATTLSYRAVLRSLFS